MTKRKKMQNTRKLIKKFIDTMFKKGKGRGETLDIKDPDFMDKVIETNESW